MTTPPDDSDAKRAALKRALVVAGGFAVWGLLLWWAIAQSPPMRTQARIATLDAAVVAANEMYEHALAQPTAKPAATTKLTGANEKAHGLAKPAANAAARDAQRVLAEAKTAAAAAHNGIKEAQLRDAVSPYFLLFGLLGLGALYLVSAALSGKYNPFAPAMGFDNRLSTSKLQALLWTGCVGFVYAAYYADRALTYGFTDAVTTVPDNVLFALGISATSAVAAKAIASAQVGADPTSRSALDQPSYDPAALVRDDDVATVSLNKVQILFWTVIAIVIYLANAVHGLGTFAACSNPSDCTFPNIDTTLMIFMGLGHATYLGGKLAQTGGPSVTAVAAEVSSNGTLGYVVRGTGFGTTGTVVFDGDDLPDDHVTSWAASEIHLVPPDPAPAGKTTVAVRTSVGTSPAVTVPAPSVGKAPAALAVMSRFSAPNTAALTPPASVKSATLVFGIDVSSDQGKIDWAGMLKDEPQVKFAYAQATYGSDPPIDDAQFARNHDVCEQLGIAFGAYHFLRFPHPGDVQAQHFLSVVGDRLGSLIPMVDIEGDSGHGASLQDQIDCLAAFSRVIEAAVGVPPIIYTEQGTWNSTMGGSDAFSGHKLWVANFTLSPTKPPAMPTGWKNWTIYQFSDSAKPPPVVSGDQGKGLDLDVLAGALTDILRPTPPARTATAAGATRSPTFDARPASSTALATVVYNGIAKNLKGYAHNGTMLFKYEATNTSVSQRAWRPDAGCPPGRYTLAAPWANDLSKPNDQTTNNWMGEGRWFVELTGIPNHSGIGIHGGGSCNHTAQAALQAKQILCPTENCIRIYNEDLANFVMYPLAGVPIQVVQAP